MGISAAVQVQSLLKPYTIHDIFNTETAFFSVNCHGVFLVLGYRPILDAFKSFAHDSKSKLLDLEVSS